MQFVRQLKTPYVGEHIWIFVVAHVVGGIFGSSVLRQPHSTHEAAVSCIVLSETTQHTSASMHEPSADVSVFSRWLQVAPCHNREPHDWELCLFAHEGEKARRREPWTYRAVSCPEAKSSK